MSRDGFSYRRLMYDLVDNLRDLRESAETLGEHELSVEIGAGLEGLESHVFRLAVVGEFKRGKSTFINALLGSPILPADILPTSATLNRITYGLTPSVELHFHDSDEVAQIPVEALAEHVTKLTPEAEERSRAIAEAVVRFPVPFCRNDIDLYDTPGLADEARMTAITMDILPRVDAVILVVMSDSPFSASEGAFLDSLYDRGLRRIITVVTGMDRVRRERDRQRLLDSIEQRIRQRTEAWAHARLADEPEERQAFLVENGAPLIFGVSGQQALEAKLGGDDDALGRSGFPVLERFLERFLTENSDSLSLRRRLSRVQGWCDQVELALEERSRSLPGELEEARKRNRVRRALMDVVSDMVGRELAGLSAEARTLVFGPLEPALTRDYPTTLRQALAKAVRDASLSAQQLSELDALLPELRKTVFEAQVGASRVLATGLTVECEGLVLAQRHRLASVAVTADRVMRHLRSASAEPAGGREASTPETLCGAFGCRSYPVDLLRPVGSTVATPPPDRSPAEIEGIARGFRYSPEQLFAGLRCAAVEQAATIPANANWLSRSTWELTAASNFKKAVAAVVAEAVDRVLVADPLAEKVLAYLHGMQAPLRQPLERFVAALQEERVQLSLREQRLEVLLERGRGDLAKSRLRVEGIRSHAHGVARQLACLSLDG
jgi:GTPase SAR1 family protein